MSGVKNIGDMLKEIDDSIKHWTKLMEFLDLRKEAPKNKPHMLKYISGEAEDELETFALKVDAELEDLRSRRRGLMQDNPMPPLVCPHCGYKGDFDVNRLTSKSHGFRLMRPILEPRLIMAFDGVKMTLSSSRTESFEQFEGISDLGHNPDVDDHDNGEDFDKLREQLRGKWLIMCGNDSCMKYFDATRWVTKSYRDYSPSSGLQAKWKDKLV